MSRLFRRLVAVGASLPLFAIAALGQNSYTGTCDNFQNYIASHGVTDANGVSHPGFVSWTTATYNVNVTDVSVKVNSSFGATGKLKCYDGFATFTAEVSDLETRRLTWDPTGACDSCGCAKARDDWNAAVDAHIAADVDAANKTGILYKHTFQTDICVPRTRNPQAAALTKMTEEAQLRAELDQIDLDRVYAKSAKNFDNSAAGQVTPPNCAACEPCPPGQNPSCSFCPPPNVIYKGKCVAQCGPFIPGFPSVWQNCGINNVSKQPVSCCNVTQPSGSTTAICNPDGTGGACP
jgi:hypothetical protein